MSPSIGDVVAPAKDSMRRAVVSGIQVKFDDDGTYRTFTSPADLVAWHPPAPTYYCVLDGSDSFGDGTEARPWRSVAKLAARVPSGGVGLLGPGLHPEGAVVVCAAPGVTFRPVDPAQATVVKGRVWVQRTATRAVWEDIVVDGSSRPARESQPTFMVNATGFTGRRVGVTNGRTHIGWNLGGTTYGRADGFVLDHCWGDDCGRDPVHDHGFYVEHATGGLIVGGHANGNSARGYSLYPDAQGCRVVGAEAAGNGAQGLLFAGGSEDYGPQASCDNVVSGCSFHGNGGMDVDSWNGSTAGMSGNVVQGTYARKLGDRSGFSVVSPLSAAPVLA